MSNASEHETKTDHNTQPGLLSRRLEEFPPSISATLFPMRQDGLMNRPVTVQKHSIRVGQVTSTIHLIFGVLYNH